MWLKYFLLLLSFQTNLKYIQSPFENSDCSHMIWLSMLAPPAGEKHGRLSISFFKKHMFCCFYKTKGHTNQKNGKGKKIFQKKSMAIGIDSGLKHFLIWILNLMKVYKYSRLCLLWCFNYWKKLQMKSLKTIDYSFPGQNTVGSLSHHIAHLHR